MSGHSNITESAIFPTILQEMSLLPIPNIGKTQQDPPQKSTRVVVKVVVKTLYMHYVTPPIQKVYFTPTKNPPKKYGKLFL